jgi:hypothetical protein
LLDYQELAVSSQLVFLDERSPKKITELANWRCLRCGRDHCKSYKAVKYGNNPCRCWAENILSVRSYELLALELTKRFKTQFIFSKDNLIPKNVRHEVKWEMPEFSFSFWISYYDLHYHGISSKVHAWIKELKNDAETNIR